MVSLSLITAFWLNSKWLLDGYKYHVHLQESSCQHGTRSATGYEAGSSEGVVTVHGDALSAQDRTPGSSSSWHSQEGSHRGQLELGLQAR